MKSVTPMNEIIDKSMLMVSDRFKHTNVLKRRNKMRLYEGRINNIFNQPSAIFILRSINQISKKKNKIERQDSTF